MPLEEEPVHWPFYVMEHERTEDHHFAELALRVGCRILVDTALECGHAGEKIYGADDFREFQRDYVEKFVQREAEVQLLLRFKTFLMNHFLKIILQLEMERGLL